MHNLQPENIFRHFFVMLFFFIPYMLKGQNLWKLVAQALSCKRIARHSSIADNDFRSSQVTLLLGKDGKVIHTDNDIR